MEKNIFFYMALCFLAFSCQSKSQNSTPKMLEPNKEKEEKPTLVGGDRDEHGCIGSAGYQWSEVRKECLRLFETGIRLNPVDSALNKSVSAFIILSEDQSKAELFLPNGKKSTLLTRVATDKKVWELDPYRLSANTTGYILEDKINNKILYKK